MSPVEQLSLTLPHDAAFGGEDFFVTDTNRDAVRQIAAWPDWPHHALVLVGDAGAGKSHLAAVWQARARARLVTPTDLVHHDLLAGLGAQAILVEDVDRALESADTAVEEGLFHLFNWLREQGGWLLLTARSPVVQWPVRIADLRSRMAAAPLVRLGLPDDELREAVMVKLFADRQMRVDPQVIRYALARLERSFAAVREFVDQADRASLAAKRGVTVPLARTILER
ncbi:MAG: hypothetical protein D6763_09350 [Alphaproteobacteria bacterium]|nr:MAG: hypothetical protein D6763_09350 [Alphaproteobacteria bacterium]